MVLMGMELPLDAIRAQIASGIDILIHLGRLRDRSRKVLNVAEISGWRENQICVHPLFEFRETGMEGEAIKGCWEKTGELKHQEKLRAAGLCLPIAAMQKK